jgi:hypothetical protein
MTADQAAQMLVRMMEDTEVPFGVRAKIAQDLLDRAGLIATQVRQIVPTTEDPVMRSSRMRSATRATGRRTRLSQPSRIECSNARRRSSRQKVSQPTTRRPEWQR